MDERLANIHPGEVLEEEFLKPFHISVAQLAKAIRVPHARVEGILREKRRIAANIALRLAKVFGTSAQLWLGLQMDYDLEEEQRHAGLNLERIQPFREARVDPQ